MRRLVVAIALLGCFVAAPAAAHEIHYDVVRRADALSVRLMTDDGDPLAFAGYEISREGEGERFQTGKTDALGRVLFLPDRAGRWRVKVFSESGHGVDFSLETNAGGAVVSVERSLIDRYARPITGLSLLFGFFGLLQLVLARRKSGQG